MGRAQRGIVLTTDHTQPTPRDPFPGPQPLQADDGLYGRDDELLRLRDLLVAHRIVLLYSPSGAGKSSLLEAGLRPRLIDDGFRVIGPLRVGPAEAADGAVTGNPFSHSVVAALDALVPEAAAADPGGGLKERVRTLEEGDDARPLVLVFDQFEELLTATLGDDPTSDDEVRAAFVAEVGDVLRDKSRWAVFAMREDHIAALDPFLHLVPTQLSTRFRIDLLRHDQALEAVKGPVRQSRPFDDDAAEALVTDLRQVRLPQRGGEFAIRPGRFVEPLHLQLVCRRLWNDTAGRQTIGLDDVTKGTGDGSTVERALSDYYAGELGSISREQRVDERRIRDWVDRQLIVGEHRGRTLEGPLGPAPPEDPLLQRLVESHLIRMSKSGDAVWYELAHDRLIDPVERDNREWRWRHGGRLRRWVAVMGVAALAVIGVSWALATELRSREAVAARDNLQGLILTQLGRQSQVVQVADALEGHVGAVDAVAISPDGSTLASGGADGTVILWDIATREQVGELAEHDGPVYAVAFDPDGTSLASGSADGTVILWDPATRERIGEPLQGPTAPIRSLAFTPDGTTLASGGIDRTVSLWDVASHQRIATLEGQAGPIGAVALSPDGGTLASGGADGKIILWDIADGTRIRDLDAQSGSINAVEFTLDGSALVSGGANGTVALWDLEEGEQTSRGQVDSRPVYDVEIAPDGTSLASGGADGTVVRWGLPDLRRIGQPLRGHAAPVRGLAFTPDGRTLASGGADGKVVLWGLGGGDPTGAEASAAP